MVSLKFISAVIATAVAVVSAAPLDKRIVTGKSFDHFMVVVLENEDYSVGFSSSGRACFAYLLNAVIMPILGRHEKLLHEHPCFRP
jgi:hypothetical protein